MPSPTAAKRGSTGTVRLLTIGELARRTGVTPAVLRTWEARHGFPRPVRLPSGHRRYAAADVAAVEHVLRRQQAGVRLEVAVAEAFRAPTGAAAASSPSPSGSVFATLRRSHPHLAPFRLRKATLVALSHAIEDECCARAQRPVLFAGFQRPEFYARAARRWDDLARTARATVLLAATSPLPDDSPLRREWVVGCDAADLAAVLTAWEVPGQAGVRDRDRVFEAIWTVDPTAARVAARVCAGAAGDEDLTAALAGEPSGRVPDLTVATTLFNRVVAYVDGVA